MSLKLENNPAGDGVRAYELPEVSKREVDQTRGKIAQPRAVNGAMTQFELHPSVRKALEIDVDEAAKIEAKVEARLVEAREQALNEAREKGYAEGFEAGRTQGLEEFRAACQADVQRLAELANAFETAAGRIYKENERFILELIAQIAKKVVLRELQTDRDYLTRVTSQIVESLGTRENIRIWINGEDLDQASIVREELKRKFGELRNLQIEVHPEVTRGGCVVESDWKLIDATIEAQFAQIQEGLIQAT